MSERQRLRLLKGIHKISAREFEEVKEAISQEMIDNLSTTLKGLSEKNVEQLMTEVGMGDLYQTAYRLYCADAHSSAHSLKEFLKYDSAGIPQEINWKPESCDYRSELIEVSRIALNALRIVGSLFGLSYSEHLQEHFAEHHRLEELVASEQAAI